ncbi:MAG: cell division protein FtsZ [Candidatus Thermoplasmatota archaeon]|nr:cell division protein FtsZ [Candidatus Thermoplasmatota archaeon]
MGFKSIINEYMNKYDRHTGPEETKNREIEVQEVAALVEANPEDEELRRILSTLKTNIKIVGCGGGGCNTVNRIVEEGIIGADLYAMNSDAQHLLTIHAPHKILLGKRTTRGLGAGAVPNIGRESAREAEEEIRAALMGADMVFVTCGLGGGTGTGSAPVVAEIAKQLGALTIAVVTKPFAGEGEARMENAEWGLSTLEDSSDTVIVIPNDKLLQLVPRLPLNAAFKVADEILMKAIKGITEMVTKVGLVNLDFADLKTIMKGGGVAVIGIGESDDGNEKALKAVEEAINSPLLEYDISSANGALICVTGGEDMTVTEAEMVAEFINTRINKNSSIIWGAYIDPELRGAIRVMLVLVGVTSEQISGRSVGKFGEKEKGYTRREERFGIQFVR